VSKIKLFVKDSFLYGFGAGLKKFVGLLLLPLYTRYLSPADYGILETIGVSIFFISTIFNIGLDSAEGRYFYFQKSEHEKGKFLFTTLVLRLITIVPSLLLGIFSKQISILLFNTDQFTFIILLSCLIIPVNLLNNTQGAVFRYYRQPINYNIIIITKLGSQVGFAILFVVILQKGVLGVQSASLFSGIVILTIAYYIFNRKKYVYQFDFYWAKKLLLFGYPLIFAGVISWVYLSSDRFFILYYHGTTEVGLYSVGAKLAQVILLLNMAVGMSLTPLFMSIYAQEDNPSKPKSKAFQKNIWYIYLYSSISISLVISIFSVELMRILATPSFINGTLVLPLILFTNVLYQTQQITGRGISLSGRMGYIVKISFITAILNLGLNFLFVPRFGFIGAAVTTIVSAIIYCVLSYWKSQKYFRVNYNILSVVTYFILAFLIAIFFPFAQLCFNISVSIVTKLVVVCIAVSLPLITGVVDISSLKKFFNFQK